MTDDDHKIFSDHWTEKGLPLSERMSFDIMLVYGGDPHYHLQRGSIEHVYSIDKEETYATCACGRVVKRINR